MTVKRSLSRWWRCPSWEYSHLSPLILMYALTELLSGEDSCCRTEALLRMASNGSGSWEPYWCDAVQHMPLHLLVPVRVYGAHAGGRHPHTHRDKRHRQFQWGRAYRRGMSRPLNRRKEELLTVYIVTTHPVLAVCRHLPYIISFHLYLRASCQFWLLGKVDSPYPAFFLDKLSWPINLFSLSSAETKLRLFFSLHMTLLELRRKQGGTVQKHRSREVYRVTDFLSSRASWGIGFPSACCTLHEEAPVVCVQ